MAEDRSNENNVTKIFYDDIREKKVVARGIHSRASRRRGIKGTIRFPSDHYKPSEIRKMHGEVKIYNMYDEIIGYDEFKKLSKPEQKKALSHWLYVKNYPRQDIAKKWTESTGKEVKVQAVHDWVGRLKLTQKKPTATSISNVETVVQPKPVKQQQVRQPIIEDDEQPTFYTRWSDKMKVSEFAARVTKLLEYLDNDNDCVITFEFKEYRKK